MREILELDGFTGAQLEREVAVPASDTSDTVRFCARYTLTDLDSLNAYFAHHAPRLREDGLRRFGGNVRASRRVLERMAVHCENT